MDVMLLTTQALVESRKAICMHQYLDAFKFSRPMEHYLWECQVPEAQHL